MPVTGCIAVIHPGQTGINQIHARILPLALHIRHQAAIAVFAGGTDYRLLPVTQGRKRLSGAFSMRLTAFGRINGGNAHGDLLVSAGRAATGGEGVAVADGDDQAKQGGGEGHWGLNVGGWAPAAVWGVAG